VNLASIEPGPVSQRPAAKPRAIWVWLGRLVTLAALAGAAAAATGTLLGFWARRDWRLELLAHFRVQYFWALAIAATLLAMRRWPKMALLTATAATANLLLILPLYVGPAPPAASGPLARGMSLNVFYHNHEYSRVLDEISLEKPDFVLLLEVTPKWVEMMEIMRPEYPFSRIAARPDSSGMALYSRLPIERVEIDNLAHEGLPTIVAQLLTPTGPVTLFCTHTASPRSPANLAMRNQQLESLAKIVENRVGPVMVMGDFNTTSWSPFFAEFLVNSGLSDSRRGFGVQPTWPAAPLPLRIPIDHCLVSPEVGIYGRHVGHAVGSDHRPIIVDFAIVPSKSSK
jgi:endonuclease/exonuclease/phosphatase (EEP) superfamily protein YafD